MDLHLKLDELLQHDLSEVIETMMDYADFIDRNYFVNKNNKLMRYWQSKDITLKSILLADLMDWLCCLAFSDGFISSEEVNFINKHLKQNFSDEEIIDLCKFRINQDYFKHLPLSFILLYEHDLLKKNSDRDGDFNSIEHLYMLFMVIGIQFIYCDGEVYIKELKILTEYADELSKRINDFNLIQNQIAILEASGGVVGDEYSENRYPFNQEIYNGYVEELNNMESLEDITEEIHEEFSTSGIDFNPWNFEHLNPHYSREIKTDYSWNLEKNINAYYDFTGEFDNHLADIDDIITLENRQKLENTRLTPQQYRSILNKIKSVSDSILYKIINENYIDFNSLNIFEKMLLYTKTFVDTDYKSFGNQLGVYSFNKIHLDERLDIATQTITLIHELAHHLLAEILEQSAMLLLGSDKTDALELYVQIALGSSNCFVLLNEYCAHSVANRFLPTEYHNFSSFLNVLSEFDVDDDKDKHKVFMSMLIGNTFCQDILTIIESFLEDNLSEDIKQEFKKEVNNLPNHEEISFEIENTMDINQLLVYINFILLKGLDEGLKDVNNN